MQKRFPSVCRASYRTSEKATWASLLFNGQVDLKLDWITRYELLLKWVNVEITFSGNQVVVHRLLCVTGLVISFGQSLLQNEIKLDKLILSNFKLWFYEPSHYFLWKLLNLNFKLKRSLELKIWVLLLALLLFLSVIAVLQCSLRISLGDRKGSSFLQFLQKVIWSRQTRGIPPACPMNQK